MNTSMQNSYDSIEQLIVDKNIGIKNLTVDVRDKLFFVVLNTNQVLAINYDNYPRLRDANLNQLKNYEIIAKGKGLHWPGLDEDLSLKGFLRDYLESQLSLSRPLPPGQAVA
jgi:hypothetical protein